MGGGDVNGAAQEAASLRRFSTTFEALERWRSRGREIEEPQPGSDLAGDIAAVPGVTSDQIIRHALTAATQHLNLARTAIESRDLYPIAHPSVLRGALIGSCRAVWLTWPDDPHERQQRALRIAHESHNRFRQYAESAGLDQEGIDIFTELATSTKAAWAPTPTLRANAPAGDGLVIAAAAEHLFLSDPGRRQHVKALWMQGSGDAHCLPWPAFSRPHAQIVAEGRLPGYPRRMASVALGGSLEMFVDDFMLIFTILRRGWSLFDQRCTGP